MRAVLMLARLNRQMRKLIDEMADRGDFEVPADFFEKENPVIPVAESTDTVSNAYAQGRNAACHDCVLAEHNPYPADTPEATSWLTGFTEVREPAETATNLHKPATKSRAKKTKEPKQ